MRRNDKMTEFLTLAAYWLLIVGGAMILYGIVSMLNNVLALVNSNG